MYKYIFMYIPGLLLILAPVSPSGGRAVAVAVAVRQPELLFDPAPERLVAGVVLLSVFLMVLVLVLVLLLGRRLSAGRRRRRSGSADVPAPAALCIFETGVNGGCRWWCLCLPLPLPLSRLSLSDDSSGSSTGMDTARTHPGVVVLVRRDGQLRHLRHHLDRPPGWLGCCCCCRCCCRRRRRRSWAAGPDVSCAAALHRRPPVRR